MAAGVDSQIRAAIYVGTHVNNSQFVYCRAIGHRSAAEVHHYRTARNMGFDLIEQQACKFAMNQPVGIPDAGIPAAVALHESWFRCFHDRAPFGVSRALLSAMIASRNPPSAV